MAIRVWVYWSAEHPIHVDVYADAADLRFAVVSAYYDNWRDFFTNVAVQDFAHVEISHS